MRRSAIFLAAICAGCSDAPRREELRSLEQTVRAQAIEIFHLEIDVARMRNDPANLDTSIRAGLESFAAEVRLSAVQEIRGLSPDRRRGFHGDLRRILLGDPALEVRVEALAALPPDPEAEAAILYASSSGIVPLQRAAAAALGVFATESSLQALARLARNEDPATRTVALGGLGLSRHPDAARVLLDFARTWDRSPELERAIEGLGRLRSKEAFDLLKEKLGNSSEAVRWECLRALGNLGDSRAVPFARPFLRETEPRSLREAAILALGRLRDAESRAELERTAVSDPEPHLREAACRALGSLGDPRSMEALSDALGDGSSSQAAQAAWDALLEISSESVAREELLVGLLAAKKRKAEIDLLSARIRRARAKPDVRRIEAEIAEFLMKEKDYRHALEHWKAAFSDGEFPEGAVRMGVCLREVGDLPGALDVLRAQAERSKPPIRARIELARTFAAGVKDPYAAIKEILPLDAEPALAGEDRREAFGILEGAVREVVRRLAAGAEKQRASEVLRSLGKKALDPLLADLEADGSRDAALVEAANLITGSVFAPNVLEDPVKREEAIKTWKTFR